MKTLPDIFASQPFIKSLLYELRRGTLSSESFLYHFYLNGTVRVFDQI